MILCGFLKTIGGFGEAGSGVLIIRRPNGVVIGHCQEGLWAGEKLPRCVTLWRPFIGFHASHQMGTCWALGIIFSTMLDISVGTALHFEGGFAEHGIELDRYYLLDGWGNFTASSLAVAYLPLTGLRAVTGHWAEFCVCLSTGHTIEFSGLHIKCNFQHHGWHHAELWANPQETRLCGYPNNGYGWVDEEFDSCSLTTETVLGGKGVIDPSGQPRLLCQSSLNWPWPWGRKTRDWGRAREQLSHLPLLNIRKAPRAWKGQFAAWDSK